MTEIVDRNSKLEEARAIAEDIIQRKYGGTGQGTRVDSSNAHATAKDVATMTLARIAVPGDYELHEAVFAMVRQLAAQRWNVSEGEIGNMGVPLRG